MREYEIHISNVIMFVEADSEGDAVSSAERLLMESAWGYGAIEVAE